MAVAVWEDRHSPTHLLFLFIWYYSWGPVSPKLPPLILSSPFLGFPIKYVFWIWSFPVLFTHCLLVILFISRYCKLLEGKVLPSCLLCHHSAWRPQHSMPTCHHPSYLLLSCRIKTLFPQVK